MKALIKSEFAYYPLAWMFENWSLLQNLPFITYLQ